MAAQPALTKGTSVIRSQTLWVWSLGGGDDAAEAKSSGSLQLMTERMAPSRGESLCVCGCVWVGGGCVCVCVWVGGCGGGGQA